MTVRTVPRAITCSSLTRLLIKAEKGVAAIPLFASVGDSRKMRLFVQRSRSRPIRAVLDSLLPLDVSGQQHFLAAARREANCEIPAAEALQ